jgi:hypothetical protein
MTGAVRWGLIGATTIAREWMIAAIRAEGEPSAPGEDGLRAMAIVTLQAARSGRETAFEPGI